MAEKAENSVKAEKGEKEMTTTVRVLDPSVYEPDCRFQPKIDKKSS